MRRDRRWQRGEEASRVPRTVEEHLQDADAFAARVEPGRRLVEHLERRTDHDRHAIGFGMSGVAEELIVTAGQRADAIHGPLHDLRHARIVRIAGLACLEERVGVVRGAPDYRMLG